MKRPAGLYLACLFQFLLAAMAMEGFRETYERLFDTFPGTDLQYGLDDTVLDMIFVLAGSLIVALAGNRHLWRFSKEEITGRLVIPKGPPAK